jgi:hypothetical protein
MSIEAQGLVKQYKQRCVVDGVSVQETPVAPLGRLGLVIWIDNQSAAFTPEGRVSFTVLPTPAPEWLEIKDVTMD